MSLSTQSATRIDSRRRCVLQKGRKKNVDFTVDSMSFYPIIAGMKGRICYAVKNTLHGFEKLLNFLEAKASFLEPVTSRPTIRKPFRLRAAAGSLACRPGKALRSMPAADFFLSVGFITPGRLRMLDSHPQVHIRTGHYFYDQGRAVGNNVRTFVGCPSTLVTFCLIFFTVWFGPLVGDVRKCTLAGQPF